MNVYITENDTLQTGAVVSTDLDSGGNPEYMWMGTSAPSVITWNDFINHTLDDEGNSVYPCVGIEMPNRTLIEAQCYDVRLIPICQYGKKIDSISHINITELCV